MTANDWIPNPGTGNPVREGETLTELRFRDGSERVNGGNWLKWSWSEAGQYTITHYRVAPPRTAAPIAEPATMSADEVLIRAREALIGASSPASEDIKLFRHGNVDEYDTIQAILIYERDRAKPLAEVAPPSRPPPMTDVETVARALCKADGHNPDGWAEGRYGAWVQQDWRAYRKLARAALAAATPLIEARVRGPVTQYVRGYGPGDGDSAIAAQDEETLQ